MHRISAAITPKSSDKACLAPRKRLVSISRKNTGPMNTKLSINPSPTAEKISSNIRNFTFIMPKNKETLGNGILFL